MKIIRKKAPLFQPNEVEIREPLVKDFIDVARITEGDDNELNKTLSLLSVLTTIDGKRYTFEEWKEFPFGFFTQLSAELGAETFGISEEQLSNLLQKASDMPKS